MSNYFKTEQISLFSELVVPECWFGMHLIRVDPSIVLNNYIFLYFIKKQNYNCL